MKDLCDIPMIEHILLSLTHSRTITDTVVATTTNEADDILVDLLESRGYKYFRGDEDDVLLRYLDALKAHPAEYVVRITADNPLTDPEIVDSVVTLAMSDKYEYTSNHLQKTYPLGYVVEVISERALVKTERLAQSMADREHVTLYLYNNRAEFNVGNLAAPAELRHPDWRLTVDTKEDFLLMEKIFKQLYRKNAFIKYSDVAKLLLSRPDLLAINAKIRQRDPLHDA